MLAVHREGVGDFVPTHDAVVGDVADQQVTPVADPHRSFGPTHAGGEFFHAGVENPQFEKAVVEDVNERIRVALAQGFCGRREAGQSGAADGGQCGGNSEGFFQETAARVAA